MTNKMIKPPSKWYRESCRDCPRLSEFLREVKRKHNGYFCKPVAPFGALDAALLIVGLAPGLHGANASGRPFTGDHAGILLYQTLHHFGFASAPKSQHRNDGLILHNCRITNVVKCLPPANKPTGDEAAKCNHYLKAELSEPNLKIILALGGLAHRAILRSFNYKQSQYTFSHNATHYLDNGLMLIDSYHCSRYNTQTKRLTEAMFRRVFKNIATQLKS